MPNGKKAIVYGVVSNQMIDVGEIHILAMNSCAAATLCVAAISGFIAQKKFYGGIWPFTIAIVMFSIAWLSALIYILDFESSYFVSANKIFLFAGCVLFLIGILNFVKAIAIIIRSGDFEKLWNYN